MFGGNRLLLGLLVFLTAAILFITRLDTSTVPKSWQTATISAAAVPSGGGVENGLGNLGQKNAPSALPSAAIEATTKAGSAVKPQGEAPPTTPSSLPSTERGERKSPSTGEQEHRDGFYRIKLPKGKQPDNEGRDDLSPPSAIVQRPLMRHCLWIEENAKRTDGGVAGFNWRHNKSLAKCTMPVLEDVTFENACAGGRCKVKFHVGSGKEEQGMNETDSSQLQPQHDDSASSSVVVKFVEGLNPLSREKLDAPKIIRVYGKKLQTTRERFFDGANVDWRPPMNFFRTAEYDEGIGGKLRKAAMAPGNPSAGGGGEAASTPQKLYRFKYGIVLPEVTCMQNIFHGFAENTFSIYDALMRAGIGGDVDLDQVAIVWEAPEKDGWGKNNKACPSRETWPYGVGNTKRWEGKVWLHLMGIPEELGREATVGKGAKNTASHKSPLGHRVFFINEQRGAGKAAAGAMNPWEGLLHIEKLILGQPRTCVELFPPYAQHYTPTFPFYAVGSMTTESVYCANLLESARRKIMLSMGFLSPMSKPYPLMATEEEPGRAETSRGKGKSGDTAPSSSSASSSSAAFEKLEKSLGRVPSPQDLRMDRVVSEKERQCPRVLLVRRPFKASGRAVHNWDDVKNELAALLVKQCPEKTFEVIEVSLEKLSFQDQVHLVHNTTIFIGARGAGYVNVMFQRRGSASLSLSIADKKVPVTKDQYPWYPFSVFAPQRHIAIVNCLAVTQKNIVTHRHCLGLSRNFCDMTCPIEEVRERFSALLRNLREGYLNGDAAPKSYEGLVPAVEERKDGLYYK